MGERKRKYFEVIEGDAMSPDYVEASYDPGNEASSVSTLLRQMRLRLGYELRDIATTLRIRYVYLQAIEEGRFGDLPGSAYAVGFLRSYSEYLGLDSEAVIRRYKDEASGSVRKPELYFPTPVPEGRIPGGTILLSAVVLAGVVYGGWYYLSATDRSMVDFVPTLPDRLMSLLDNISFSSSAPTIQSVSEGEATPPAAETATPPPVQAAAETAAPAAPVPPVAASSQTTVTVTSLAALVPPPVAATPATAPTTVMTPPADGESTEEVPLVSGPGDDARGTRGKPGEKKEAGAMPPAVPEVPPSGRVFGAQGTTRIEVRALQESWIQVRDANGELLITRVLKPGDVYRVPDKAGVRLRTGNAGGLSVAVDGGESKPLGVNGQVLKDVVLDPQRLLSSGAGLRSEGSAKDKERAARERDRAARDPAAPRE